MTYLNVLSLIHEFPNYFDIVLVAVTDKKFIDAGDIVELAYTFYDKK